MPEGVVQLVDLRVRGIVPLIDNSFLLERERLGHLCLVFFFFFVTDGAAFMRAFTVIALLLKFSHCTLQLVQKLKNIWNYCHRTFEVKTRDEEPSRPSRQEENKPQKSASVTHTHTQWWWCGGELTRKNAKPHSPRFIIFYLSSFSDLVDRNHSRKNTRIYAATTNLYFCKETQRNWKRKRKQIIETKSENPFSFSFSLGENNK